MRGDWGDVPDVDTVRAANVDPLDAYLWRGISWKGAWVGGAAGAPGASYEGREVFAVRSDGTLFWGRSIGRKTHDTSLAAPSAGVLVTPGKLQAEVLALSQGPTWTSGAVSPPAGDARENEWVMHFDGLPSTTAEAAPGRLM